MLKPAGLVTERFLDTSGEGKVAMLRCVRLSVKSEMAAKTEVDMK